MWTAFPKYLIALILVKEIIHATEHFCSTTAPNLRHKDM